MNAFACNRCGACCRRIVVVRPDLAREDGSCVHLRGEPGNEHACAIYENRPKECRVDEGCPPAMELAEWHRRNEEACGKLRLEVYGHA